MEQLFIDELLKSDYILVDLILAFFQLFIEMKESGKMFYFGIAAATSLASLGVWLLHLLVKNVNKAYKSGVGFALCSVVSFFTTFCTVIILFSLQFTEPVVKVVIKGWELSLIADRAWNNSTFRDAYENVAELKNPQGLSLEDFSAHPHPDVGGNSIPGTSDKARLAAIDTYIKGAIDNFDNKMPFLSWILSASSGNAKDDIYRDMTQIFSESDKYEMSNAVEIASEKITKELIGQAGRIIVLASIFGIVIFIFIQSVITALLSWRALRRIQENF